MSTINITANHDLGLSTAKERVEKLAEELKDRLGVEHHWSGDTLELERSGASGTILVEETAVTIDIKLGLMLASFKSEIERQLRVSLDEHLQ